MRYSQEKVLNSRIYSDELNNTKEMDIEEEQNNDEYNGMSQEK